MSSKTFNNTKINVEFDEDYQSRTNINSGENISSLFAKIRRFILDLKAVCFSGSYNDLSDTPVIPSVDAELSPVSENPVQNKAVSTALDSKLGKTETASMAAADSSGADIAEQFSEIKNKIAVNTTAIGMESKNLLNLKSKVGTYTSNGITFVINDDGSVTANGTATANVFFYMLRNDSALGNLIYGKEVKLTGCPEGGSASTYSLRSLNVDGNIGAVADLGNGRVFTYTNTEKSASFYIAISEGVTVTDLTFYPMLRYVEITDDTFETYKPTLLEQIEELKARITALGG